MSVDPDRFARAMQRFDAANALDPAHKELLYAERMTHWLNQVEPDASEALRLAARSQHIRRWEIPRSNFPDGRVGYLNWRKRLSRFHADTAEKILREEAYDKITIARVRALLQKERIKTDPEMQTLEDVICLVFLQHHLTDFADSQSEDRLVTILQRTWAKMSPRGHEFALKLKLGKPGRDLLDKAVEKPGD